ncbi:MAG: sigma-70 family RNA polymerase sigma factor [Tepidisphaeraceae bacterium]
MGPNNERSPQELLLEFTTTGRQEPFAEIVRRYAGMVFHVCHQVVKNTHDAEDVTQAVFLTLATQSRNTQIKYIGPWLQQVAYRLALDVRKSQKRREIREIKHFEISRSNGNGNGQGHAPPASEALDQSEMKSLVADELNKLPTKYRLPLILHYFGGMSRDEMARELRCKPSTLGVRLFRGREMLSERLAERGIVVGVGVVGVLLGSVVRETISQNLYASVCHYATSMAAGHSVSASLVPSHILVLAQTASRALLLARIKTAAAATIIGATALVAGAEVVARVDVSGFLPKFLQVDLKNLLQFKLSMPRMQVQPPQLSRANPIHLDAAAINPKPLIGAEQIIANFAIEPVGTLDAWAPPSRYSAGSFTISGPLNIQQMLTGSSSVAAPPAHPLLDILPAAPAASSKDYTPSIHASATGSPGTASHTAEAATPSTPSFSSGLIHISDNPNTNAYSVSGGGQRSLKDLALKPSPANGRSPDKVGSDAVASARPAPLELAASAPADQTYVAQVDTDVIPLALLQRQLHSAQTSEQTDTPKSYTLTRAAAQPTSTYTNPYPVSQRRPWNNTDTALAGWGNVDVTGTFDNSGQVIADGRGKLHTLSLDGAALITNSIDNPPDGSAGWYAINCGKLVLPPIHLARGQKSLTWGESPADPVIDLVNSVRLTFAPVAAAGQVSISLLAPDRSDIPGSAGDAFLDVWSIEAGTTLLHDINATIRLDSQLLGELGYSDSDVMFWKYDRNQWNPLAATAFSVDPKTHLLTGDIGDAGYFAISGTPQQQMAALQSTVVPEPAVLSLLALGATLLIRRRRL